jgi:hypothetical protein
MLVPEVPLPWERLLWSGRGWWPTGVRYALTDFRVVRIDRRGCHEIAVYDIVDVRHLRTFGDRAIGTSTIVVHSRRGGQPLILRHVRRGAQLAALLELVAGDPLAAPDEAGAKALLSWDPRISRSKTGEMFAGLLLMIIAVASIVIGLRGESPGISYPPDDAIYPNGEKRDHQAIADFMEAEVLPWAQVTLGPLKGGADKVGCETCHGPEPEAGQWKMPAVSVLPEPHVELFGSEVSDAKVDAQMRNAMYGYLAESDNQAKAAYMRKVVVPGMARLLGRPAYDFTKSYEYNRTRFAIGCYHCHMVSRGEP